MQGQYNAKDDYSQKTAGDAQVVKSRLEFPVDDDRVDSTMIVPPKPFQESL